MLKIAFAREVNANELCAKSFHESRGDYHAG
jgi:hypothetical protein